MRNLLSVDREPDLVERVPVFLQRLDPKQPVEMFGSVVVAASDAERRREESFLDVVTDRAPGDATKIREVANCVAGLVGHEPSYMTVTVALSTVAFSPQHEARSDPGLTPRLPRIGDDEPALGQDRLEARILPQRIPLRIRGQEDQVDIARGEGPLEPLERGVLVAQTRG